MGWNKKKLHVQEEGPRFWGLGWRPELIALVGRGNYVRKRKMAVVELLRGKNMETLSRRREQPAAVPTKRGPQTGHSDAEVAAGFFLRPDDGTILERGLLA